MRRKYAFTSILLTNYLIGKTYLFIVRFLYTASCLFKTVEYKRLHKEAKLELKKSKRKDYYKILSISKTASEDDIKKAYKKSALVHHPGK